MAGLGDFLWLPKALFALPPLKISIQIPLEPFIWIPPELPIWIPPRLSILIPPDTFLNQILVKLFSPP